MINKVFSRNEKGNLCFECLEFEILIDDFLREAEPKDAKDLEWAVKQMVDNVQLAAYEYARDTMELEDWEDLFLEL